MKNQKTLSRPKAVIALVSAALLAVAGLIIPSLTMADGNDPAVTLQIAEVNLEGPAVQEINVTVTNTSSSDLSDVSVEVGGPINWTLYPRTHVVESLPAGDAVVVTSEIFVPGDPPNPALREFRAEANYTNSAGAAESVSTLRIQQTGENPGGDAVPLAELRNNVGTTTLDTLASGNFDGDGNSFSRELLAELEATPGAELEFVGATFTWPDAEAGEPDNVVADGQHVALEGSGTHLAVLGSGIGSNAVGQFLVHYTDGSASTGTLGFGNWFSATPAFGGTVALSMAGRNTPAGLANTEYNYGIYVATIEIESARTVSYVTLPTNDGIHVFDMAFVEIEEGGETADSFEELRNNVGTTSLETIADGDFDGEGNSFSRDLLAEQGLVQGETFESLGATLTWPDVDAGQPDNVLSTGQTFKIEGQGEALVFVGSGHGGGGSGPVTIHYTDGSTALGYFGFPGWTAADGQNAYPVAITLGRHTPEGLANTDSMYNMFETSVAIDSSKQVAALTLPNVGALHIFAIGFASSDGTVDPEPTPTPDPSEEPTPDPSEEPTPDPSEEPTPDPSEEPTEEPTEEPSEEPEPTGPVSPKPGPIVNPQDIYVTPGFHYYNGRHWHTTCEPYSQTYRCRTEIWATTVVRDGANYKQVTGWAFNNLTYLPQMERGEWAKNPLGFTGTWTAADGREWKTECDTAATGRNGCRSYAMTAVVETYKTSAGATAYRTVDQWLFNNIVLFKP